MSIRRDVTMNSIYHIQVLDRAFQILDKVAETDGGMAARFLEKNPDNPRYRLGSRLMELGLSAVAQLDVYQVAGPHLRWLTQTHR